MLFKKNALLVIVIASLISSGLTSCFGRNTQSPTPNSKTKVKVIGLFPLTGPGASLGDYLKNGAALAEEDVEKRYPEIDVEIKLIDSKNQPKEGVSALQAALTSENPDVVVSGMSSVSKAIIPLVEGKNIPTIVTTTALSNLPQGTKNVVRIYPTSENFVEPIAKRMVKTFSNIAVLYVNDDFGKRNKEIFTGLVKQGNKNITSSEPFELAQTDARATIAKLLATSPDAIFVTGYGPAYISIFKQLRESNKTIPIYTEIGFANPSVLKALGDDANGIIFDGTEMELSKPETQSVINFQAAYTAKYKADPYQVAGFAYDSISLIVEAKMKNGGKSGLNKSTMTSLSPFQGVMGPITLDSQGESQVTLQLMKRENGKTVKLTD